MTHPTPKLKILHHGRCFDGVVSAALLGRLLRALGELAPRDAVTFAPMTHRSGPVYDAQSFNAPLNAIVDFRYSADPRVRWWVDHHATTFDSEADRAHFEADTSGRRIWDPDAPSCAGLIHQIGRERFGVDLAPADPDLVDWADRIDAARFDSAAQAVALASPPLRFMFWLEAAADDETQARAAAALLEATSLETLLGWDAIARSLETALAAHEELIERIRGRMEVRQGVAWIDLSDRPVTGVNKFIPYALDQTLVYAVTLLDLSARVKVAVGENPWRSVPRPRGRDGTPADVGAICRRHGGGGHAAVGAVSLPAGAISQGRAVGQAIVAELRQLTFS